MRRLLANPFAEGWARHGASNEKMAQWLADVQRQREEGA